MARPSVMITGGLRGLGLRLAQTYLRYDYNVIVSQCTIDTAHEEALADLTRLGHAQCMHMDLRKMDLLEAFWQESLRYPCPDIWINNAGVSYSALTSRSSEDQLNDLLDINLRHTGVLACRVAERMSALGRGHMINIVSHQAVSGGVGLSAYGLSKGAMLGLSRDLAKEWGVRGVRVNAVAPGFMLTDMTGHLSEELINDFCCQNTLGCLSPLDEITQAIYDISQWRHVSGQLFVLDSRILNN